MNTTSTMRPQSLGVSVALDEVMSTLPQESYAECAHALTRGIGRHFPALTQAGNPVVEHLEQWSSDELMFLIEEYSCFSNAAVHMLLDARIRNHWPDLTTEIIRNIDEELGSECGGIPHLELMRHGYRMELGIETDDIEPSAVTADFIRRLTRVFRDGDNAFLAGALLAFEATAVDEFRSVDKILRRFKTLNGGVIAAQSLTGRYIAGHVCLDAEDTSSDPEMDHYLGMLDAVGRGVAPDELDALMRGFLAVCTEMSRWWQVLVIEAAHNAQRARLLRTFTDHRRQYLQLLG